MIEEREKQSDGCLPWYIITMSGSLAVGQWLGLIPFELFEFWKLEGSLSEILASSSPLLLLGIGVNLWIYYKTKNLSEDERKIDVHLFQGSKKSLRENIMVGIYEEVLQRWGSFYGWIAIVTLINMGFDWIWIAVPEIIYVYMVEDFVNLVTFGQLESFFSSHHGFEVGAAILISNWRFQKIHGYKDLIGILNFWIAGLVLFYVMYNHGIYASILIHVGYNLLLHYLKYLDFDKIIKRFR